MQGSSTLISTVSEESALKDTQVDEYYTDIDPIGFETAFKVLTENPYPGLRPFKTTESIVFFGREGISSELITRLAERRFLAVLGSSGTGKSSIVRAGLLPVLETLPGRNGSWKVAICRPGKNPFGNLARALFSAKITNKYTELEIWKVLSSSSYGYQQIYNSIEGSNSFNTLIIIDQFEELFRYRNDYGVSGRNDAALFVKMLIDTSQNEKLNTYVMITMRSEYLGDCVQLPQLVDAINNGQYLVPRLKSRQLLDVIKEPAIFGGFDAQDPYAIKLIGEIGDNMDQLPVLQHVLRRAYESAVKEFKETKDTQTDINHKGVKPPEVTYEDYEHVGKMETALDKHAKEVYDTLTTKQQEYCKIVFQSITDRTTDGRGIRRPLPFLTLVNICKEKETNTRSDQQIRDDLKVVIDSFRKDNVNFLMPPPHVELSDDLEIDISHESLMRIWTDLQRWMEEEAKDANLLDELLQRDKNDYIKGAKLVSYIEWLRRKKPGISWASLYKKPDLIEDNYDEKFIDAISLVDKSKKKQKIARLTLVGLIAAIFLLSIGVAFLNQYKNSQLNSINDQLLVKNKQLETDSLTIHVELANKQNELRSTIEKLSKSERDLKKYNDTITAQKNKLSKEVEEKQKAFHSLELAKHEIEANLANESKLNARLNEATKILELQADSLKKTYASANKLKNLALAIKHSEKSLAIPAYDLKREDIKAHLALVAYQLYKQSGEEENRKLQPQVYSSLYFALRSKIGNDTLNKDVWPVTSYQNGLDHLAYAVIATSRDKHAISYLTAEDRKFYSFDFENKKTLVSKNLGIGNKIVGVEASANGNWIAINTLSKKLLLINNENNTHDTISFSGIVRTSKFSVDGHTLYSYTQDSVLTEFNLTNKTRRSKKIGFKIEDIAISNKHIYGLTTNGDVIEWDKTDGTPLNAGTVLSVNREKLHRGTAINCTPDDGLIVWGNENGQAFYIKSDFRKAQYLTRFGGPITKIAFNDSFNMVGIASYDKTIQVFNLSNLQAEVPLKLTNNEGPVTSLFFQTDNTGRESLVAVLSPGVIRVYPMDLETLACKLYDLYKDKQPSPEDLDMYLDKAVDNRKVEIKCK